MKFIDLTKQARRLSGPVPAHILSVDAEQYREFAATVHSEGGRLAALWATDQRGLRADFLMKPHWLIKMGHGARFAGRAGRPVFPDHRIYSGGEPHAARSGSLGCVPMVPRTAAWLRHVLGRGMLSARGDFVLQPNPQPRCGLSLYR